MDVPPISEKKINKNKSVNVVVKKKNKVKKIKINTIKKNK